MGYVEQNLLPDEKVVYRTHLSRIVYGVPIVLAVAALVVIIFGFTHEEASGVTVVGALILVVAGLIGLGKYVQASSSEFAVTNRRVLIKVGAISHHTLELLLQKVEGVGVDQELFGRMFGYGTIVVTGTGGTKERFADIANALEFRRQVQAYSGRAAQQEVGYQGQPAPAATDGAGPFCVKCGFRNAAGARFCASCGTPVSVG